MNKKLLKILLFISASTILVLTILPIFLDKKKIITAINSKIKDELNLDIDLGEDFKLTFFPFPECNLIIWFLEMNQKDFMSKLLR